MASSFQGSRRSDVARAAARRRLGDAGRWFNRIGRSFNSRVDFNSSPWSIQWLALRWMDGSISLPVFWISPSSPPPHSQDVAWRRGVCNQSVDSETSSLRDWLDWLPGRRLDHPNRLSSEKSWDESLRNEPLIQWPLSSHHRDWANRADEFSNHWLVTDFFLWFLCRLNLLSLSFPPSVGYSRYHEAVNLTRRIASINL